MNLVILLALSCTRNSCSLLIVAVGIWYIMFLVPWQCHQDNKNSLIIAGTGTVMVFPWAQLDGQCFSAFLQQLASSGWAQGSEWGIYYVNVCSYVLGMSISFEPLMNSSLNDLEHQVWKSQVLNEADGWQLRKTKPVHQPDSPTSCVCFSICFDFEEWGRPESGDYQSHMH